MRRPRIAYVVSRFPHLSETFILRELVQLERNGWDVLLYPLIVQRQPVVQRAATTWLARARRVPFASWDVVTANAGRARQDTRGYVATLAATVRGNLRSPRFLARALALWPKAVLAAADMRQLGVEHVHAHYATHTAFVAWAVHRLVGIPYSITAHAHDIFVDRTMLGTKLGEASFVVTISDFNRSYLAATVGPQVLDKTFVVRCGVPAARRARSVPWPARGEPFVIASVGSLQPYKGFPYLVRACAVLRERGIPFRCLIAGDGADRHDLHGLIRRFGLERDVQLLGPRSGDEIEELLASAHCYVQPSIVTPSGKMEGIPVAIMEAMAAGLTVVATAISGVPELVRDGETGYLVAPGDAVALADGLERVFGTPLEAAAVAARGRELVRREYDVRANVARLEALFLGAAATPAPATGERPECGLSAVRS